MSQIATLAAKLWQRWPEPSLLALLRATLPAFREVVLRELDRGHSPETSCERAYREVCDHLIAAERGNGNGLLPGDILRSLGRNDVNDLSWLQSAASFLAMLLHYSIEPCGQRRLVNHRRPHQTSSTYPNSPAVTRLLAHYALAQMIEDPLPQRCTRDQDARRYAARVLRFRLLDTSMESGQFLLEVALQIVRAVHRVHPIGSSAAHRLNEALLRRLCHDCLWGVDRHPASRYAVGTVFRLLTANLGIPETTPRHLLVGDSLRDLEGEAGAFDIVLNNPPWGKPRSAERREKVRAFDAVAHRLEYYVAFTEIAIRCLRPGGVYGLVLPSQFATTLYSLGLRRLLHRRTRIEHAILLPRTAFAQATVRGLILLGRTRDESQQGGSFIRTVTYPLLKPLRSTGAVSVRRVSLDHLSEESWRELVGGEAKPLGRGATVALERVARVLGGIGLYTRGSGRPPQTACIVEKKPFHFDAPRADTTPAVRGRCVREFATRSADTFVLYGPWLADPGSHGDLLAEERIFVREVCGRDGKLTAAPAEPGVLPLKGVVTVFPHQIDLPVLLAILNSQLATRFVRYNAASFSKVDFQCIKVKELRRLPIPIGALRAATRRSLGFKSPDRREVALRLRVDRLSRRLMRAGEGALDDERERHLLDEIVATLYDGDGSGDHAS